MRTMITTGAAFLLGIASGAASYLIHRDAPAVHIAGTAAWPAHLVLTAVAIGWILLAARRPRLRPPNPFTAGWSLRGAGAVRAVPAALLDALCLYLVWRVGFQIPSGFAPSMTAKAWGGPGYTGALYCHVLDAGLLLAVALLLLRRLLPGRPVAVRVS